MKNKEFYRTIGRMGGYKRTDKTASRGFASMDMGVRMESLTDTAMKGVASGYGGTI